MTTLPIMFRPLQKYAEFHGRAKRAEFWLFLLFMYVVAGVFAGLMYLASLKDGRFDLDTFLPRYMQFSPLYSLFSLGTLVPYLAVAVRRLHDTGRTGWWLTMPYIVSFVGFIVFFAVKGSDFVAVMMTVAEAIMAQQSADPMAMMNPVTILKLEWPLFELMLPWVIIPSLIGKAALLILLVLPGTRGENRFGPSPAT